ncbi:hypothetical protein C8Q79DRAFT_1002921 [Trametes meyenii]|nr:hypothetical protein C8Q79DRAFT_1002921 [Trametes meyenii]
MDYVPRPPLGVKEVFLHDDCRYGEVDPIQWPQLHSPGYEYLCAVSRPIHHGHRLAPVWWTPDQDEDFELLPGSIVKCLGLLKPSCLEPLSVLVDTLIFPCTFRDVLMQVRAVQQFWLMASAFLDYYGIYTRLGSSKNPLNRGLMGTFTSDPVVVQQLFLWGIPVWWLRQERTITEDTRIYAQEDVIEPPQIFQLKRATGAEAIYHGMVGTEHLDATCRAAHTYRDISHVPLLDVDESGGAKAQRWARKNIPGIEKFTEIDHEWMPPPLAAWKGTMDYVAAGIRRVSGQHFWGYWILEPGLFVRTKSPDRVMRYFITWLHIRPGWLYLMHTRDSKLSAMSPQWWHNFLYGETGCELKDDTLNGLRQQRCKLLFNDVFKTEDLDLSPTASPTWFGHRIETVDPKLCAAIIWEICEMGFRHELLALDRLLVPHPADLRAESQCEELIGRIFVDRTTYTVVKLPEEANVGLSARLPHSHVPYLEALRKVIVRWPRCPPSILCAPPPSPSTCRPTSSRSGNGN